MSKRQFPGYAACLKMMTKRLPMARRKKRLDRKLHRRYLELGVIDASQDSSWRRELFGAPAHALYVIDARNCAGLPKSVTYGIRRYGLSYTVSKVPRDATPYRGEDWAGLVVFRFAARRHSDLVRFSVDFAARLAS